MLLSVPEPRSSLAAGGKEMEYMDLQERKREVATNAGFQLDFNLKVGFECQLQTFCVFECTLLVEVSDFDILEFASGSFDVRFSPAPPV
jgi:hypothetical protein